MTENLLPRLADSNEHAEQALCAHFKPLLELYGRRHVGDMADDLVQETLATVITKLREGKVEDPAKLGSFVFGVAKNKARELRRSGRRREHEQEDPAPPVEPVLVGFRMRLFGCLSQLSERAREVLSRTYFGEETGAEIAAQLALSPSNVRVLRHRSLAALRRCLEGDATGESP